MALGERAAATDAEDEELLKLWDFVHVLPLPRQQGYELVELAAELSYPSSPDAAAAVLNISAQVWGIALILACDGSLRLLQRRGPTAATVGLAAALAVAAMCAAAIRGTNRRQDAQQQQQ